MNCTLNRLKYLKDGIFGELLDDTGAQIATTCEHTYVNGTTMTAKVAPGTYTCTRHAPNRLPYETFELQNVPDFQGKPVTGILLHILNFGSESEGCVGLGESMILTPTQTKDMITNSKIAFEK